MVWFPIFPKSEKSLACDKCKNKSAGAGGVIRNGTEEAAVAEFLVELPTKTLIMDNPNPLSICSLMPVRFCAPMEKRVHVQGVPGGDPDLFSELKMSFVFGPQLWNNTGYVRKKFNFRCSEFPCLGDDKALEKKYEEVNGRNNIGHVDQADNGVGCLLSLSKENDNNFPSALVDYVGLKSSVEAGRFHEVQRYKKKLDVKNLDSACPENSVKKEGRSKQPILQHSQVTQNNWIFLKAKGFKVVPDRSSDDLGECVTNLAANECGPDAIVTSNELSKEGIGGEELPVSVAGKEEVAVTSYSIVGDDIRSRGDTNDDAGSVGYALHNKESIVGAVKVTGSDAGETHPALHFKIHFLSFFGKVGCHGGCVKLGKMTVNLGRFSLLVEDLKVKVANVEAGGEFTVSSAEDILKDL